MQYVNNGRFQLKTKEDIEEFALTQMQIENPEITKEYLTSDWDPGCPSCVPETEKPEEEDFLTGKACDLENKEDCDACQ